MSLRSRLVIVCAMLLAGTMGASLHAQEVTPHWFRSPAVSPDGRTIAFCHGGDLYLVPIEGGRAIPITVHPAYDCRPVWSPDGKSLAFASDRFGNFDVFVMPAGGGEARRITHYSTDDLPSDFTPDGASVIFESSRVDDVESVLFPSRVLPELYRVSVQGGTPAMLLTTPAINARFDKAGARLLYEDVKGYEDELRKHHTSAIARDIWVADMANGRHIKLTDFAGEDRHPQWSEDESSVYFLSERAGDFNVFRMPLQQNAQAEQLTFFENHPVRELTSADDGTLVFSWHGDIYELSGRAKPRRVPINVAVDTPGDEPRSVTQRSDATEFSVSSNGKEVAFVVRGDIFVTSTEFSTTRRVTNTPEQERSVDFAPDGRRLVYASERNGSWNIYESSLEDDGELYFFSATKIVERPVITTEAEEFQPKYAPDGRKVAYLHNRTRLNVIDLESSEVVTALPGTTFYSYSDGDHWFEWSPDSSWLAVHYYNRERVFVTEIGLIRADGTETTPLDLSNSGYEDVTPHWAMDGGAIIWASNRYGERSHGSWGSEFDVLGVFLTQDAYDRFRLTKEEYELKKELEEKEKESEKKKKKEDDSEEEPEDEPKDESESEDDEDVAPEPVKIELDGIESRIERLTIHASDLADFAMTPDGDKLFYLAQFEKGFDLWMHDFREESTKLLKKLGADSASMQLVDDGKALFILADGSLSKIDPENGEQKSVSFAAALEIHGEQERTYLFDHVWRQTQQKFYRPDMHGVDWDYYRSQYEPKLNGITNNQDLAVLLSELLGELNASHTGARYRAQPNGNNASTASLGIFSDQAYEGEGIRIAEIMEGGPLDRAEFQVEEGMVITHVDGQALERSVNFYETLNGKAGQRVRLTIQPQEGDAFDEVVKPISLGEEGQLRYDRWVRSRRDLVEEASGGRLGYVHVRSMNDESFRDFYSEVLGRHYQKEGLIVDTRFNGGGWLHDDLVTFLSGERYVDLYPRNDEAPNASYVGEPARRWWKPSIVVMSESNYSDAHFFPWAYVELQIGDTVGMPVPGTATAVWWERLHTGDLVFGIPQVGTKGESGEYLENQQLEPTYMVPLDPVSAAEGRDTQILKAVEVLLRQIDE